MAEQTGPTDTASEAHQDSGPTPKPSPLKHPRVRLILSGLVVVLVVVGGVMTYHHLTVGQYRQSTEDALVQADFVTVSPRISGTVEEVMVSQNQWVKAGDPLVRISSQDYTSRVTEAEAQVLSAVANEKATEANIAEQGAAIVQARAQVEAARADLGFAEKEVQRFMPLAASGAEADVQYQQLRNNRDKAAAQLRSAEAALQVQERRVTSLTAQREQAVAQQKAAEAQVTGARVNADAALIRATTAGRIGDLTVRPGQTVQPGLRLMSIVPTQAIYVEARFKETQMGLVRTGQPVSIEVDALPDAEIHGVVESISPATSAQFALIPPQNATGNFTKVVQRVPVRIRLEAGPEARKLLVPGLSVTAIIDTRNARHAAERIKRESEEQKR